MSSYLIKRQAEGTHTLANKIMDLQNTVEALKKQINQKQDIIKTYQKKIHQQEQVIEEKDFIIQEKDLTLQHILKENQELHQKIFELNQSTIKNQNQIKETIKTQIGSIKEEFNFMLKETQYKNQIILDSKVKDFKRREHQLEQIIKDLSERGSSNGSFYYQESHSNIIKSKKGPNSHIYNYRDSRERKVDSRQRIIDSRQIRDRDSDFYNNQESQPDRATNTNSQNFQQRQSVRSSRVKQSKNEYSRLGRSRQIQRQQQLVSILSANLKSDSSKYSSSSLLNYHKSPQLSSELQRKYQYVPPPKYQKAPTFSDIKCNSGNNYNNINMPQSTSNHAYNKPQNISNHAYNKPQSASNHEYNNRSKTPYNSSSANNFNKQTVKQTSTYPSSLLSKQGSQSKLQQILSRTRKDQRCQIQIKSRNKIYETNRDQDDKRKQQKLKQINSLKMKVNMLKCELKQEISFCQDK